MKSINLKELAKGLLIIGIYYILPVFIAIPLLFFINKNIMSVAVAELIIYITMALIFSIYYRKNLKEDFKDFKKNFKSILKTTFLFWITGLVIMYATSYIIQIMKLAPVVNQEDNIEMLRNYPVIEFLFACLLAPIIEELVFRKSLIKFTTNKHIYAITSGLIFGFIHITTSLSLGPIMLLYIIPYSAVGVAFGYAYYETKNIYGTIIVHGIHNLITLLLILLFGGIL